MEWFAALKGDSHDLEQLAEIYDMPECQIIKEGNKFLLKSNKFDKFELIKNGPDVRKEADKIIKILNGVCILSKGLLEPIITGRIICRKMNEKGERIEIYSEVVDSDVMLTIIYKEKTPKEQMQEWIVKALKDEKIFKILKMYGENKTSWSDLYNILEVIADDVGGETKIVNKKWAGRKSIERFKHTANSPEILGERARHLVQNTISPKEPMSHREAKFLIRNLMFNWLNYKEIQD